MVNKLSWGLHFEIVVPTYKGGDRSVVTNCRTISLTTAVCKQMEHVKAGYLKLLWDKNDWLYDGQHGFRPGYSCVGPRSYTEGQSRRSTFKGSQSNIRCTTGESFGLTFVSSLLFANDCIMYMKIVNHADVEVLQNDLDAL
jgi:hypothetical protein